MQSAQPTARAIAHVPVEVCRANHAKPHALFEVGGQYRRNM